VIFSWDGWTFTKLTKIRSKGFSGSCIQRAGHNFEVFDTVSADIAAFWKVLPEQPVGVFIVASLPRSAWITEVDC
jgi:hypothetical protein